MANTYESKFKGVEIDDGVNIATYATGTGGINVTIKGTTNVTGTSGRHLEIDGSGKQDKLTVSSNVHINSLTIATTSATGLYFTNETGAGISYRILVAASGGTAPLARLTVPNDIAGKTQTIATREYVNAHSSSYNPGSGIDISGNTISLAKRIMVDNITLGNYSSGNVILLPQSGASGNVYFPKYGGTLATTGDVPLVVQTTGSSMTSVMSQKTVTDELGKKQNKITDQTSLNARALSANSLNIGGSGAVINGALTVTGYSSLNGIFVDNSTTKPICFKRNGSIVTKMYGPTSGGGELVNVYLPGKGGTIALTSDIPTGGGIGVSYYSPKDYGPVGLGTFKSMQYPEGYQQPIDDGNTYIVPLPQVKTLFGNQSVLGTGNIDLYRHNVQIRRGTTGSEKYIYTSLYSSNDTPIESLTDLKTMLNLSASETYPAYGLYNDGADHQVMYITPVGANLAVAYMTGSLTTTTLSSGVVTDTMKAI